MGATRYYSLVASLPRLEYFERAERDPITRKALDQRLNTLEPEDARQLALAEDLLGTQRQPVERSSAEIAALYRSLMQGMTSPGLRDFVEFRMSEATVLAALRMRRQEKERPEPTDDWGVGRWKSWIEQHWEVPDFGLGTVLPWVPKARAALESGDAVELQRLMMDIEWKKIGALADAAPFGFEEVFGFVFRWNIVHRWLGYDAEVAKTRFQELVGDVTREHQRLFD